MTSRDKVVLVPPVDFDYLYYRNHEDCGRGVDSRIMNQDHSWEGTRFGLILNAFMNAFGQSGAERTPERPPFEGTHAYRL